MGEERRVGSTVFYPARGQVEVTSSFPGENYLWNPDFHPTPVSLRSWGPWTYTAIWFGMVFVIPTWFLAAAGFSFGLNWWEILLDFFLGSSVILIPTLIQSHGGARYGMSEPQLTRTRWGIYGAQIPSWIRAIISMGWWGIVSYIITEAAVGMYAVLMGKTGMLSGATSYSLALTFPRLFWLTFIGVIALQVVLFYFSPPTKAQPPLKFLARMAAPIVALGFAILFAFVMTRSNWNFSPIVSIPQSSASFALGELAYLNAVIADWATMAISMPDFTRFASSQRSQAWGQLPMPFMMTGVAVLALLASGATMALGINGGAGIIDPVVLATVMLPRWLALFVLFAFALAMFVVNVFANSVAPGYDIANTYSKHLSWFRGIVIGIAISAALGTWTFYASGAYSFIYNWLLAYGALLGAVEGIIVFDYAVIRRFKFEPADVYLSRGKFRYWKGFNPAALIAFALGTIITYASHWGLVVNPITQTLYAGSWISAFFITGFTYLILMKFWVIPRYQPFLKGGILHGYMSEEVKELFEERCPQGRSSLPFLSRQGPRASERGNRKGSAGAAGSRGKGVPLRLGKRARAYLLRPGLCTRGPGAEVTRHGRVRDRNAGHKRQPSKR